MGLTVAIMQPYFLPYAGYFRLFAATDLFVIYDCVQFPRRGWVHRNRLVNHSGRERWLTLPLQSAPQTTLIRDLRFPANAAELLAARLRAFPLTAEVSGSEPLLAAVREVGGYPIEYIEGLLGRVVSYLGLPWRAIRSTELDVPDSVRGQDRILEIAKRVGACTYLNASGGRGLYDPAAFAAAGIELRFLSDYPGSKSSILTRVLHEQADDIAREIRQSAVSEPGL